MEPILPETKLRNLQNREVIQERQQGFAIAKSCLTKLVAFYNGGTTSVDKARVTDYI